MMIGQGLEDALAQSTSPGMSLTGQQEPITSACSLFEPLNNFTLSDSEILDHHQPWHIPLAAHCVTRMIRSQLGQITSIIDQASQDTESSREGFSNISASYLEASLQSLPISKRRPTITMPHTRRLHNTESQNFPTLTAITFTSTALISMRPVWKTLISLGCLIYLLNRKGSCLLSASLQLVKVFFQRQ